MRRKQIRMSIGEQLWSSGDLAEAFRLWNQVLAPVLELPEADPGARPRWLDWLAIWGGSPTVWRNMASGN